MKSKQTAKQTVSSCTFFLSFSPLLFVISAAAAASLLCVCRITLGGGPHCANLPHHSRVDGSAPQGVPPPFDFHADKKRKQHHHDTWIPLSVLPGLLCLLSPWLFDPWLFDPSPLGAAAPLSSESPFVPASLCLYQSTYMLYIPHHSRLDRRSCCQCLLLTYQQDDT